MYGALIGDYVGSPYEFDRGKKTKDFEFFNKHCSFTDDSVMTCAVAQSLIQAGGIHASILKVKQFCIVNMVRWAKQYPQAGYGGRFYAWIFYNNQEPYNSYGNGSAMRVSPVGWLFPNIERTREMAKATAEISHNHPEGIKGAEATASAIFLARTGASKDEIKKYIEDEFEYNLDRTIDEIRPIYHHVESCQETVPEAIIAFLESESFEDAIRNVISIGGDTDTSAAICGSIAEAYYGIPKEMINKIRSELPRDMKKVVDKFYKKVKKAK